MTKSIFVAGHSGMVGSALVRQLSTVSHVNIVTRSRAELDLSDQQAVAHVMPQLAASQCAQERIAPPSRQPP